MKKIIGYILIAITLTFIRPLVRHRRFRKDNISFIFTDYFNSLSGYWIQNVTKS